MKRHRHSRRTLPFLAGLVLAAALAGCASLPERRTVELDGTRISSLVTGSGGPTVVLQSGLGDDLSPWSAVISRLVESNTVFAYDRPGYGASVPAPDRPRSPCDVARELREALRAAGLPPPYLLVGHSLGGQYQYAFARLFPHEVAGLVLLDPTHPDHWTALQQHAPAEAAVVSGLRATLFSATMRSEFDGQGRCLDAPRRIEAPFASRILLSTRFRLTDSPAFRRMVGELAQDWRTMLPAAEVMRVESSGHYIQRDRPDVVAAEIAKLSKRAR